MQKAVVVGTKETSPETKASSRPTKDDAVFDCQGQEEEDWQAVEVCPRADTSAFKEVEDGQEEGHREEQAGTTKDRANSATQEDWQAVGVCSGANSSAHKEKEDREEEEEGRREGEDCREEETNTCHQQHCQQT